MNFDRLIDELSKALKPRRFHHTLGSFERATAMALRFGVDPEKAGLGALLHDCARRHKTKEQWRLIEKWNVETPGDDGEDYPSLWHTWLGPEVARREHGLDDEEIANAIRTHTTGRPDMTPIEEIVLVADCVEPMREYDWIPRIQAIANEDLKEAVRACLQMKHDQVVAVGRQLHPLGEEALRAYSE